MRASTAELYQSEERLKEYQRQQERLKAMTANSDKVKSMSADVMIENLLKQNFVKPNNTNLENRINSGSGLPNWLESESPEVPGQYKHLWAIVKTPTNFADTQKVSQLLLTSGLPMEVLGFIWNLSNKAVLGQLNKQEFYIVLALVALAQSGYSFNNLSILNLVPSVPIPALQTKVLENFIESPTTSNSVYINQVSPDKTVNEETFSLSQLPPSKQSEHSSISAETTTGTMGVYMNEPVNDLGELKSLKKISKSSSRDLVDIDNSKDFTKTSHFPCIGSSPTAELEDDDFSEFQSASISELPFDINKEKEDLSFSSHSDEFTDFQCADIISDPLETVVISQKKEIPKIPLPRNLSGKFSNLRTNILKISPESEKKLKVLTQSETLSTLPESKISANNKVSTMTSISVLASSRDIGMRLANHSLGSKSDKSKHQRQKHKPAHVDEMGFPSKFGTIDELFPKCFQRTSCGTKTYVLKETKIGNTESLEPESYSKSEAEIIPNVFPPGKNTRRIEIPMLGTLNETTLPTQTENVSSSQPTLELFSVEEDKYSALREVELEMKMKHNEPNQPEDSENINRSDGIDDFGEFLSADIPPAPAEEAEGDLWGEWSDPDPAIQTNVEKPLEFLAGTKFDNGPNVTDNQRKADSVNVLDFDLLSLTEEDNTKIIPTILEFGLETLAYTANKNKVEDPFNSVTELDLGRTINTERKNQDSDDFMMLGSPTSDAANCCPDNSAFPSSTLNEDFGMFFTSEVIPPPPEANKEDLLPSLNLKTMSSEGREQETMRKKCMTVCLNLIQQGLDILNGVKSAVVLREVLSTEEAVNYLNNLNIIYQISRRMGAQWGEAQSSLEVIERVWRKLVRYCYDYHITLKEDLDNNVPMGTQCHVCLGFIGTDIIDDGFNSYHPSCANFLLNCVVSELP